MKVSCVNDVLNMQVQDCVRYLKHNVMYRVNLPSNLLRY